MLTLEERELLKSELKTEITNEINSQLKGKIIKEDTQSALKESREKWFTKSVSKNNKSIMFEVFGVVTYWCVWELIRKLTCYICGCSYVRHLEGNKYANEICDELCACVYGLKNKYNDKIKESEDTSCN